MKRPISPQVAARRCGAATLAHQFAHANRTHTIWAQAVISSHQKIPQGTVSRDLAGTCDFWREFWREFPTGRIMRGTNSLYAHKDPVCAYARIIVEWCVSPFCLSAFNDFRPHAGAHMESEKHSGGTTQVIARQSEAATGEGTRRTLQAFEIMRISAYGGSLMDWGRTN